MKSYKVERKRQKGSPREKDHRKKLRGVIFVQAEMKKTDISETPNR